MRFLKYIYPFFIYLFLYLPICIIIIFSFNNTSHSLLWKGFTLQWYYELFQDNNILMSAWHSLIVGVISASAATIIGTITAISLFRYRFLGKKILHGLLFIMVITPELVMGVSLLLLYSIVNFPLGFLSLLFAHITLCMPFVAITVYSCTVTLNKTILEAARDLGASDFTIFQKIIIPLVSPSIIVGWLLSFTISIDDVITSYFVAGPDFEILPLNIYAMVRLGVKPEINVLCTLLLAITFCMVALSHVILKKNYGAKKN